MGQAARELGVEPADLGIGLDALPARGLRQLGQRAGRIAQQHALQAEPGAVLLAAGGQVELLALAGMQAPADAGAAHPLRQLRQLFGLDAEAVGHGRHLEQVDQLAQAAALARQPQQPLDGADDRAAGPGAQVGDVERDMASVLARVLAEHGPDRGRHQLHVGHHDHDVERVQVRAGQQAQQLVVQHLELAHRAVRQMEQDRAVVLGQRRAVAVRVERLQVPDALLDSCQQRRGGAFLLFVEQVDAQAREALAGGHAVVEIVELADEVAPLPAPGRQQRVGMQVQVFQRQLGQLDTLAQRVAPAPGSEQLAPLHDVAPVEAAGVGHRQHHLAVPGQAGQGLQRRARDMAHAEDDDAPRDPLRRESRIIEPLQHLPVQVGSGRRALLGRQGVEHRAPQCRLPALLVGQGGAAAAGVAQLVAARGPVLQPVGAVVLVLVEQVGQLRGQLRQPLGLTRLQIMRNRREGRLIQQAGQQLDQAPGHRQLVQRRFARHRARTQHLAVGAPDEAPRQLDPRRRADAGLAGQLGLEPFGHAAALHQDDFLLERRQRVLLQPGDQRLRQVLGAVAVQRDEAGQQGAWGGVHGVFLGSARVIGMIIGMKGAVVRSYCRKPAAGRLAARLKFRHRLRRQ